MYGDDAYMQYVYNIHGTSKRGEIKRACKPWPRINSHRKY